MALSTSLPTELVLRVYEECQTFTDVVNLSSCCVRLRQIWHENRDVVAFPVALKVVPAFDDALITSTTSETPHLLPNLELNEPEIAYMRSFFPFQIFNLARSRIPVPVAFDGFLPLAEYLIEKAKEDIELHELGPQSLENELVELEITAEDHKHGTAIQQFLMLQSAY
ncbi:hypothetical protein TWF569_006233 [Orbilia oligospora]|uniref:F-box domain-containing protein n=1 Tax=Orbilia oligospora TaxID=2813651 RepID=A0A7C8NZZ8_ORBOL|nr:hypothetical protein TWF706_001775 [Orbilia oligospora]KAF3110645.1 hypothetical protein TWF102_008211 [Orbilia oligospora]KAF3143466.1 hypothetical protein TWF703_010880 [Orbilia oligospora]KAF3147150.1 hypothetical protein TWF569_006233 [Orbilia oligospora]